MDDQEKNLEEEKLGFSVTLENRCGSLELSNNRDPREVENAADLLVQSKQEPSLSDSLEAERPRGTGNYNLRKSLAWDSAFFTSKGVLDPENDDFELLDTGNPLELENSADKLGQREYEYLPSDSLEPEIPSRGGKFNLRQSIAWDSAFFTSEGVLDPEELFMINKGLTKAKTHILPGIKELQRSAESNSTIDSDQFSIDSLESDLFEDIRASIQKSTSKKLDAAFQNEMKATAAIRRQTVNGCGSERTAKEISIHSRMQATRSREPIPLPLKAKKMLGQSDSNAAAPTKRRVPLGANCVEVENKSAKTTLGKRSVVTQKPWLVNSHGIIPSSTPSPRSSSGSATTNKSTVSCSPYDRSDSASSDATSLRRKSDSTSTNLTSASTPKMPLRCLTEAKNDVRNSGHSSSRFSGSVSAQKPSPCASTTSSFDGWSSESSSSTVHQRSKSKASLDGAPPKKSSSGSKSHGTRLPNQCFTKCSKVDGSVSSNVLGNPKASSLRMPSPKIGFFDVEKSTPTGLNGNFQFHSGAQSTLAKSRARIGSLGGAANRARRGKFQPARTSIGTQNVKQGSRQTEGSFPDSGTIPLYPLQFHNVEDASKKASGLLLRTTRIHPAMTVKNQNVSSSIKVSRENCCSKTPEVGSSSKAGNKGAQPVLNDRMRKESKGRAHFKKAIKAPTKEGRPMNLQRNEFEEFSCPQDKQPLENMNEKGNYCEDQVGGLIRQLGVIDLTKDAVVEPKGNMSCSNLLVKISGDCYLQETEMRMEQDEEKVSMMSPFPRVGFSYSS